MFRDRIVATQDTLPPEPVRKSGAHLPEVSLSGLDRVLLAPVRPQLDLLAPMALPVLIFGASGTGRSRAAHYLHRASATQAAEMRRIFGAQVNLEFCTEITVPL
ncbi:sigma 54-interacting transcriptional regulator (plasmid) [Rhizobium sp. RCAM05350]|nr:sigma 54-interacting transcriptional regulator [Rhizobium sp. RCAM05350]